MTQKLSKSFWEQRWQSVDRGTPTVTAAPNHTLREVAAALPPGAALDAGCGQGADALHLAEHGWTVTAVDFVADALERGRRAAEQFGAEASDRIRWREADLDSWAPPRESFDLVSAHYLHGIAGRTAAFGRLAAAVRPGGTLLIVGHHPASLDISGGTMPQAVFFTSADVTAALDDRWELVRVDDDLPREVTGPDGSPLRLRSSLVQARRR